MENREVEVGRVSKQEKLEDIISSFTGVPVVITLKNSRWYAFNPFIGIKEVSNLLKEYRNGRAVS